MKVVLDTNVLLSAAFTAGICEVLLDLCLTQDDIQIVSCEYILGEFTRHAIGKFHAPPEKVAAMAAAMRQRMILVEPAPVPADAVDDPDDLPVLGTALAGKAVCLITGDRQLLDLGNFQGVAILSPRQFHDQLR